MLFYPLKPLKAYGKIFIQTKEKIEHKYLKTEFDFLV